MSNLIAAVVGTGFIGPVHVEGLRRAGVEVAGIAGSSPEKSSIAARQLGLPLAYPDLNAILADPRVDVVHITSPNHLHFEQTASVIEAGKHVICEKPLAMDSAESASLIRLAESNGVAAAVNYNIRYYPLSLESAERCRQGLTGELFHITGSYAQDWLFHPTDFNWRVLDDQGGELRAIADIGTHWLDLIQFISGQKVIAVCADLATVYPQRTMPLGPAETFTTPLGEERPTKTINVTTEDFGCVLLRFDSGAKGVLWVSQVDAGRKNCLQYEIAGSKQSLRWNSERPNELEIGHRDSANQILHRDPALLTDLANTAVSYPGGHNEGFGDSFKQLFKAFYSSIESGKFQDTPTYPTFYDGHRELLLCEAILKSHRMQRWIEPGATNQ